MGRLMRSENKMIAGVCGGIAEHFGWNLFATRIAFLFITLCTAFSGAIAYIILSVLMPKKRATKQSYEERMKERLGL